jgi:hypothetical protein
VRQNLKAKTHVSVRWSPKVKRVPRRPPKSVVVVAVSLRVRPVAHPPPNK